MGGNDQICGCCDTGCAVRKGRSLETAAMEYHGRAFLGPIIVRKPTIDVHEPSTSLKVDHRAAGVSPQAVAMAGVVAAVGLLYVIVLVMVAAVGLLYVIVLVMVAAVGLLYVIVLVMVAAVGLLCSQLSGVMETVFKAAMYEITRLVEDSFLEEVSRSREQVESLKQRLQWSESRRRERESGGRTRCADCGRAGVSSEETEDRPSGTQSEVDEGRGLKQEKVPDGSWSSCPGKPRSPALRMRRRRWPHPALSERRRGALQRRRASWELFLTDCVLWQQSELDGDRLDAMLKEEALQTAPPAGELQERWSVCLEGEYPAQAQQHAGRRARGGAGQDDGFGVQRLHMCEEWGSGAGPGAGHGPEAGGGEELAHAYEARYGLEEELGVALEEEPKGEYMAAMLGFPADLDPTNPAHPAVARGRRAGFPQGSSPPVTDSELDCLLINEDGFLQDADRRSRGPRRGRGRRGAERRELGGGACGTDLLPPGLDSASGGHRGAPFAPPPALLHGCTHCRLSFPDLPALKAHLLTHAGAGAYTCTQCGKSFTQACNLKVHQRIHSGQGLHLCSHCGKGFLSFAELKRHKCSHGSEKPYCCSLCGNKFSRLWNLKLHRRIHTQEKPHRCAQCGKSFTRADILKVHHRTHTGERPYSCTICGLSFKRLDHLKSHQRKHS
ncbi:hypothetical protein COCON_G00100600 [Conger conger]|uniref:C2H2-type domain-containing protein n=1 Tax=Conger conger TaxID=82655 RepID=A0A9Q1DHJ4_CONCO|nr:hypothetical protein COCON_G00100600 [Conger conger]